MSPSRPDRLDRSPVPAPSAHHPRRSRSRASRSTKRPYTPSVIAARSTSARSGGGPQEAAARAAAPEPLRSVEVRTNRWRWRPGPAQDRPTTLAGPAAAERGAAAALGGPRVGSRAAPRGPGAVESPVPAGAWPRGEPRTVGAGARGDRVRVGDQTERRRGEPSADGLGCRRWGSVATVVGNRGDPTGRGGMRRRTAWPARTAGLPAASDCSSAGGAEPSSVGRTRPARSAALSRHRRATAARRAWALRRHVPVRGVATQLERARHRRAAARRSAPRQCAAGPASNGVAATSSCTDARAKAADSSPAPI